MHTNFPVAVRFGRRLKVDLGMRCSDNGIWLEDDALSWAALIVGGLVMLIPVFLAGWLRHYANQRDYTDKKHPDGIVTPDNIKEGESLGERLSQLDNKWNMKAFGFFYQDYERRFYW